MTLHLINSHSRSRDLELIETILCLIHPRGEIKSMLQFLREGTGEVEGNVNAF